MAITTTAPTIDATGISAPSYDEILEFLKTKYRGIYGDDVYLEEDSQDGQLLAVFALAIHETNSAAIAVYRSFSPATATGDALSSNVRLNGIARAQASASTVDVTIIGQAGTVISSGSVEDVNGVKWSLPTTVTIPASGQVTVTATAQTQGSVSAAPNTVTKIATPTRGWQSVTNQASAAEGAPVETDATLRVRQATSVALPSRTVLEGIIGAVANIEGVTRYRAYENDTAATDENGIPSHSLAMVVEGGDASMIAAAIEAKKSLGGGTAGTTAVSVKDAYGNSHTIRFYRPVTVEVAVTVSITALTGYSSVIGDEIKQAISDYINALGIGQKVMQTRLFVPANLNGSADGGTYEVTGLSLGRDGQTPTGSDVAIAFNEVATCTPDDVTLVIDT